MAAFIGWIDPNVGGTPIKVGKAGIVAGALGSGFVQSWAKKTTDGDGSIYFIAEINADAIIRSLKFNCDAITGLTSMDVGIYKIDPSLPSGGGPSATAANYHAGCSVAGLPNSTPVSAGAIFLSANDPHSGAAIGSEIDCLAYLLTETVTTLGATTNGLLNFSKKIWELLGFTDPKWADARYVIGVRLNTAGSAAGNMVLRGEYLEG